MFQSEGGNLSEYLLRHQHISNYHHSLYPYHHHIPRAAYALISWNMFLRTAYVNTAFKKNIWTLILLAVVLRISNTSRSPLGWNRWECFQANVYYDLQASLTPSNNSNDPTSKLSLPLWRAEVVKLNLRLLGVHLIRFNLAHFPVHSDLLWRWLGKWISLTSWRTSAIDAS
jgi:hypothetical protein